MVPCIPTKVLHYQYISVLLLDSNKATKPCLHAICAGNHGNYMLCVQVTIVTTGFVPHMIYTYGHHGHVTENRRIIFTQINATMQ